ncbi:MAG TPA: DUF2067 domain-containing protein [Aigarchaeota archaeon]|nr:DUF2067 domain-containing protein [Aigarchaeota archaeon]
MGVIKRKLYVVNLPPRIPIDKVYEKISSAIRSGYAEISIRGGRVYIEIVGTEFEVKDSWYRVRQALADLWELYRLRTRREASIEAIVKEAGRTFPPEALVYALELRGYEAGLSDDKSLLYTTASPEEVTTAARKIADAIDQLKYRVRGSAAKRMIAAIAAGLDVDVERVIEYGLRSRVLEETEDGIILREEWRRGLRKIAVMLKGAQTPG